MSEKKGYKQFSRIIWTILFGGKTQSVRIQNVNINPSLCMHNHSKFSRAKFRQEVGL